MLHGNNLLLVLGLMILFAGSISAQNILSVRDSIPIAKPKALQNRYVVNHPPLGEIRTVNKGLRPLKNERSNFWGNLTGGAITLLSGLQTSSAEREIWLLENELINTDPAYTWQAPVFMHGEEIKNRERIRNEDGSRSVYSETDVFVDWTSGAIGLILEGGDTLGKFTLLPDQFMDTSGFFWLSRVEMEDSNLIETLKNHDPFQINPDFMVKGEFRGKEFTIVSSGRNYKSLILSENHPVAVFQMEPNFLILNKKKRISPYLLVSMGDEKIGREDLIRLGLLNNLLSQFLREEFIIE